MSSSSSSLCLVRSSINIDQIFDVPHVVRPGETLSSTSMQAKAGGKGANVSAAVALAGQRVVISAAVGRDAAWPIDELHARGVSVDQVRTLSDAPTGRAFIQVAQDGENSIVLLKGANFHPDPQHADDPQKVFGDTSATPTHLIVQNEIPLETTKAFLQHAHTVQPRCTTIFNPSPMPSNEDLQSFNWQDVDVLIINEGEGQDLLEAFNKGQKGDAKDVLDSLAALPSLEHVAWIVMTKGAHGVSAYVRDIQGQATGGRQRLDVAAAKPKRVVDTTGAGDTFAGNLVAGLMRSNGSDESAADDHLASAKGIIQWAAAAAAVAVERAGAMESIPRFEEVKKREKDLLSH